MTISGLAESFKTMNRPDPDRLHPTQPRRSLMAYFSESLKDRKVKL